MRHRHFDPIWRFLGFMLAGSLVATPYCGTAALVSWFLTVVSLIVFAKAWRASSSKNRQLRSSSDGGCGSSGRG